MTEKMTENMKEWLRNLYLNAAEEHRGAASNEKLWAIGAYNDEIATMHLDNAAENIAFANMLTTMAEQI